MLWGSLQRRGLHGTHTAVGACTISSYKLHKGLVQNHVAGWCRVFEPRYRWLLHQCQTSDGCFGVAYRGVGCTARIQLLEHAQENSYKLLLKGGRRFTIQPDTAHIAPGSFGVSVVTPKYIEVNTLLHGYLWLSQ